MTMTRCKQQFEEHKITSVDTFELEDDTTVMEEEVREGPDTMPPENASESEYPLEDLSLPKREFEDVNCFEVLKWLEPTPCLPRPTNPDGLPISFNYPN
ncbi:hypothetical protein CDL15_Pgr006342 [Punica granatum]|uniref:Uncharacterized protein n=1 Tax=Punica granatum TaxID=22663 RepID=A0A218WA66_PUNGR|nr:hypothetical protein CDL15_Pgr006342 [Punica granatum]